MKRRTALWAGAAAVAGAAGAGVGWWRHRPAAAVSVDDVWAMRFQTPAGAPLALADFRGKPLLLNFWATWCPPCVSELPMIDAFEQANRAKGWRVVGLAVDNLEPVKAFLARRPVGFSVGMAGLEGVDLSRRMGNSGGGLPFSLVFDRRGALIQRKLGAIQPADLARWASTAA